MPGTGPGAPILGVFICGCYARADSDIYAKLGPLGGTYSAIAGLLVGLVCISSVEGLDMTLICSFVLEPPPPISDFSLLNFVS